MAKLKRPKPAPSVRLGRIRASKHGVKVSWHMKGAKGVRLSAIVEFEASAKAGWQTVIAGLPASSYSIALKQFAKAKRVRLRVVVSDGFDDAIATSKKLKP